MDKFINKILHYSINKVLYLFNRCITANTVYYIGNIGNDWKIIKKYKDYFEISYNVLSKTENKNIYKIDKQIRLFKYNYKKI